MRKLKLESLQVESFVTTPSAAASRGTVEGHADVPVTGTTIQPGTRVSDCMVCQPFSYNGTCWPSINICRDTEYMDCTYGCTYTRDNRNSCQICWVSDQCTIEAM